MTASASASIPTAFSRQRPNHPSMSDPCADRANDCIVNSMCNLYSLTKGQSAIRDLDRSTRSLDNSSDSSTCENRSRAPLTEGSTYEYPLDPSPLSASETESSATLAKTARGRTDPPIQD